MLVVFQMFSIVLINVLCSYGNLNYTKTKTIILNNANNRIENLFIHTYTHTFIQRTKYIQKHLFKIGNKIKFIAKIS